MKKLILGLMFFVAVQINLAAQINIYQDNELQGEVATLYEAFSYINEGAIQGDIDLEITDDCNEVQTCVLFPSGSNGGLCYYTSVTIYPSVTGKRISGSIAGPLIDLNGADNVTIDGRLMASGSTVDLTIENTSTSATDGTSTIRFINDATNNTIIYCTIKGSSTTTGLTFGGIIFFSTTTGTTGNDGNNIQNNKITNSSGNRPINTIFSLGSTGSGLENSGNSISSNEIFDFLNPGTTSSGIYLSSYTTAVTISNNSFYESSLVPTAPSTYYFIRINNTSGINFTMSGNYIGGTSASCGGSAFSKTNASENVFFGIYINAGTSSASNIQGNTIKNIDWSNATNADWVGIQIAGGAVNVGTTSGNTIGATTGTGSILVTNTATASLFGIYITGSGTVDCQNNTIGSITAENNSLNANIINGIYKDAVGGATTISYNTIGSTSTSSSIISNSASTSATQNVYGINNLGTGTIIINYNTIANLTNNSTRGPTLAGVINGIKSIDGALTLSNNIIRNLTSGIQNTSSTVQAVCGMNISGINNPKTITGNTIYNLYNSNASFSGSIVGMAILGNQGSNVISNNFIHSLAFNGTLNGKAGTLAGIRISQGAASYYNNIISIGAGTNNYTAYGIYETATSAGDNNNYYFNSVYIGGSPTSTLKNSYAFYSAVNTNTRNIRNNVFENGRSNNGSTGSHYAIYFAATGNVTCDYNDYYVSGTGGVLGYYGGTKSSLPIVDAPQDANSFAVDPVYTVAGSSSASDYTIGVDLIGITGTGITTDFGSDPRNNPTMGAWERLVNKWKGNSSTAWNLAANWTANSIPLTNANIIFDDAPANNLNLDANRSVNNITNGSNRNLVINGKQLTIKGTVAFTGTGLIDASASSSVMIYGGTSAQTINGANFVGGETFSLTIDNTPGVTITNNFIVDNSLIINTGKILTVSAGIQLTVSGTITNSAGNTGLVIKSDATGDGKLINNTASVPATVELYLTGGLASPGVGIFHYFIPPVATMTIGTTPTVEEVKTALGITNFNGDLLRYREPFAVSTKNQGWQYFHNYPGSPPGFTSLVSSYGYNIYLNGASDILKFNGLLNAAEHTFNLSYTPGNAGAGWNLIGNPYPCNYDLNGVAGLGTSVDGISNTVYYNSNGGYGYWNVLTNSGSSGGYTDILPPMTGFYVRVSEGGPSTLTLPVAYKTGSASDPRSAHKGASLSAEKGFDIQKVKLVVANGSKTDETIALLIDDATFSFNEHYDAVKLFATNTSPGIYINANGADYFMKAVKGPATDQQVILPLNVVIKEAGSHSITIPEFENLEGVKVVLKHGGIETTLTKDAVYSFTSGIGTFTDFQLIIGETNITTDIEKPIDQNFKTWYSNDYLYINTPSEISSERFNLVIYDLQGKPVYNDNKIFLTAGQTIQLPITLSKGIYIVRIINNSQTLVSKIVVI